MENSEVEKLCAMEQWGAEELAKMISHPLTGINYEHAIDCVTLCQSAGSLPEKFTPRQGIEWAMSSRFMIGKFTRELLGISHAVYGLNLPVGFFTHTALPTPPK